MKLQKIGDGDLAYYQLDPSVRGRKILMAAGVIGGYSLLNLAFNGIITHERGLSVWSMGTFIGVIGLFTMLFWRRVRARWQIWTRRFRYTVVLDNMGMDTAMVFDSPWVHYVVLDPMKTWMRENLKGSYGVLSIDGQTRRKILGMSAFDHARFYRQRTFWFSNRNDAFAFKMRWYKS